MARRYTPDTQSWKLFEQLFLQLPADQYPYTKPMPRGKAINLAMMLNGCQAHWQKTHGVPDDAIQYSAKAKGKVEDPENWVLEISISPRRRRKSFGNEYMREMLEELAQKNPAQPMQSVQPTSPPIERFVSRDKVFEDMLLGMPKEPGE